MQLSDTTSVYGHTFELNIAVENGLNWSGKEPSYKHFCMVQLNADSLEEAQAKAIIIKQNMGDKYKCTLRAIPKVAFNTQEVVI